RSPAAGADDGDRLDPPGNASHAGREPRHSSYGPGERSQPPGPRRVGEGDFPRPNGVGAGVVARVTDAAQVGDGRAAPHVLVVLREAAAGSVVIGLDERAPVRDDLAGRPIDGLDPPVPEVSRLLVPSRVVLVLDGGIQPAVTDGAMLSQPAHLLECIRA